jgi:DNA primase
LKGYARKAVLVFDSDNAGIRAAHRSIDLFMKFDMDAKVMVLPQGHDPDTFLVEYGYDEFMRYTDNASGMMRFLMSAAIEKHGLSIEGKIRILKQMQQPLAAIRDHVARSLYIKELAERIGVDEAAVIEKIRIEAFTGNSKRPAPPRPVGDSKGSNRESLQTKGVRLERQIVVMMLQFPEIIPEIDRSGLIDFFENATFKSICRMIFRHQAKSVSEIINAMENKAEQSLAAGLAMGENIWNRDGCLKLISQFETSLSRKGNDLLKQIKSAEDNKDHALLLELLKKRQMQVTQSH